MDSSFCPGSRLLRQPAPETFPCPNCGAEVEIWTDEFKRACPNCHKMVLRPGGMSCLEWCSQAKECIGEATYESYMANRCLGLKQRLLQALEEHFAPERRHVEHAVAVLAFAEELMRDEEADWHIVVPAALLHDMGVKPALEKYGSADAAYQEREGPPLARAVLLRLGLQLPDIDEVCDIIAHHHTPRPQETANFRVVYDADGLVNLASLAPALQPEELRQRIGRLFLTQAGRRKAEELYLGRLPPRLAESPKSP
jgi:DNA-directed RNA polymerase subunit RPC12/RpoP